MPYNLLFVIYEQKNLKNKYIIIYIIFLPFG